MNKRITLLITLMLAAMNIAAAPVQIWFEDANAFYNRQNYDSAALYYQKIVDAGTHSSAAWFNLGNALFRLKKTGPAILAFEKALTLSPGDPDIAANIKFANATITDRIPLPEETFFETLLNRLHTLFSLQTQLWIVFGLLCMVALLFILWLFNSGNMRLWLIYGMFLSGSLTTAIGFSAGIKIYQSETGSWAIVQQPAVDARNQPNGPIIIFTAHEGTKFRIRRVDGDWALCSLPNGVSGWVERRVLGII